MPTGRKIKARPINAEPWFVQTIDPETDAYLQGLPVPNFRTVADNAALWAVAADDTDEGSIVVGGGGGSARSYVVSAAVNRRIKAHRFS